MRTTFIDTLCHIAAQNSRVHLLCGDLGYAVLERFATQFPDRYLNVGVAEQNMTGIAAGLALSGKIVFTYSIANFPTMRCLEQIRNDVCYHRANVTIVAVGGGLAYGPAGYTHHGLEDIAVLRAMPHMTVIAPADPVETRLATEAIVAHDGPFYLRLGKGGEPIVHTHVPAFTLGRAIWRQEGAAVALLSTGTMLAESEKVATLLREHGLTPSVVSMPTIQPLDREAVLACARTCRLLVTLEEHSIVGGLGSAVAEVLAEEAPRHTRLLRCGVPSGQMSKTHGSQTYLRRVYGLDAESIAHRIVVAQSESPLSCQ